MKIRNRRACWAACRREIEAKAPVYRRHKLLTAAWKRLCEEVDKDSTVESLTARFEELLGQGEITRTLFNLLVALLPYLLPVILKFLIVVVMNDETYPVVGTKVEVLDEGLAALRRIVPSMPPNNVGVVSEIWKDGTILVQFPDGQAAPYSNDLVRPIA